MSFEVFRFDTRYTCTLLFLVFLLVLNVNQVHLNNDINWLILSFDFSILLLGDTIHSCKVLLQFSTVSVMLSGKYSPSLIKEFPQYCWILANKTSLIEAFRNILTFFLLLLVFSSDSLKFHHYWKEINWCKSQTQASVWGLMQVIKVVLTLFPRLKGN
jgi:hypothetical protein